MADRSALSYDERRGANTGWLVGGLLILAVFVAGGVFWFTYHP